MYQDQKLTWLTQPKGFQYPKLSPENLILATKKSAQEPRSEGSIHTWHRRLGHVGTERIEKLAEMTEGITIESNPGKKKQVCEACQLADAPKQISRRKIGQAYGVFGRVHFDLVQNQTAHNGHIWLTHFYLDGIRCHFVFTHTKKNECQMAVRKFIALVKNWLKIEIRVFHYDNERSAGNEVESMIEAEGCTIEHSPPGLPEMNGPAERSGGVVVRTARALINDTDLPRHLWPEAVYAAAYILNRVPTKMNNKWMIPWNELLKHAAPDGVKDQVINLSNVRLYGCLVYSRILKRVQSEKMAPRAEIGYLVGYVSKNLYKIWFPHKGKTGIGKVEIVRDAVFDETRRYSKSRPLPDSEDAISTMSQGLGVQPTVLTMEEAQVEMSIQSRMPKSIARIALHDETEHTNQGEDTEVVERERTPVLASSKAASDLPLTPQSTMRPREQTRSEDTPRDASPHLSPLQPSPPSSPIVSTSPILSTQIPASVPDPISVPQSTGSGGVETVDEEEEIERQLQREMIYSPTPELSSQQRAPRDISASIETSNIVTGTRSRKPRIDPDYATYLSLAQEEPPSLLYAFTTSMNQRFKTKPHREDLPPPPENWIQMKNHRFAKEFMAAASFEVQTLKKKETYTEVQTPNRKNTQVLPLKWVFTYKFDANGVLEKFKARICVRGDLQWLSTDEKRAATLAVKTARAVFALVAAFDLDMRQRDVVTAFLNSSLQSETYTKCPPGFEREGHCWMLHRALYGLRMSPRLWQQEATRVLVNLRLTPVPEDPCIFTTNGIIVFFYVDDIIIVNHPNFAKQATKLDQDLKKEWEMRELDATWFLNIRILRDRDQKKLWLCQDSYIESMTNKYNLVTTRKVGSPLGVEPLVPYDGVATPSQIHGYQAKVGSAQYATTISRPDAAKATSKVAEFLTNPGPKHMDAIDRIIQYLYETRYWAIEYGTRPRDAYPTQSENNPGLSLAAKSIEFASDASFGDNRDRKSSEGYLCKLYGGPIDWKASKQKTVTTSTTEAELLALAEAGKTIQWWRRVLHSLGFEPDHPLSIMCDNQQTVDLLTKEGAAMHTKLRHVDINRCWMKQEVSEGRVNVDWVPTAAMPADGLTKVLPKQKQHVFRELLGMREIRDRIIPESDGRSSS